jgi:hypothetical protein
MIIDNMAGDKRGSEVNNCREKREFVLNCSIEIDEIFSSSAILTHFSISICK